jgi:hypothetical protein
MRGDIVGKIESVQAVHADQQDVFDLMGLEIVVIGTCG